MSPVFVAIYTKLSGGELLLGEVVGTLIGLLGVGVLAAGTSVELDQHSNYVGDLVAILAAACMAAYLVVGRKLRSKSFNISTPALKESSTS
jgi:drug/metabolite transporter (DMT)-like permease